MGYTPLCGLRARVLPLQGELRRGLGEGLHATSPRRSPTSSTTTSSRPRWTRPIWGRSAAGCRAPGSRSSSRRARPGTASTRSTSATPTRSPPPTATRSTRTASRRSRSSTSISATLHGEALREGHRQLLPHPLEPGRRGRQERLRRRRRRGDRHLLHFLGGMRNHIRELALFVAPAINSYKRYAAESWAPTSVSWGRDNRTCGFRVVGHGQSRRVECRIPGADVEPLPRLRRAAGGRASTASRTGPIRARSSRATRTRPARPRRSRRRCARRSTSGRRATSPSRRSATPSTSTTSTTASSSSGLFDKVVTDYERRRMFERG